MKKIIFIIFIILLFSQNLIAQIRGPGATSCGKFTSSDQNIKFWYYFWALGYLSGAGIIAKFDFSRGKDTEAIENWLDKFCKENPLLDFSFAVNILIIELNPEIKNELINKLTQKK